MRLANCDCGIRLTRKKGPGHHWDSVALNFSDLDTTYISYIIITQLDDGWPESEKDVWCPEKKTNRIADVILVREMEEDETDREGD